MDNNNNNNRNSKYETNNNNETIKGKLKSMCSFPFLVILIRAALRIHSFISADRNLDYLTLLLSDLGKVTK